MKNIILFLFILSIAGCSEKQSKSDETSTNVQPKLVVGIVVDQMRFDYLERFWDRYGNNGFKKLMNQGFACNNTHYNYMPTYTAPGHASIYTGTTPSGHGIISNSWYDKVSKKKTYCTSDNNASGVGTTSNYGKMSPHKLMASTITDELKATYGDNAKVIGLSIKDRGAILPAGHKADLALWFEGDTLGSWISSDYYGAELPLWVEKINANGVTDTYLSGEWNTLYPIETYTASRADSNPYERPPKTMTRAVFPYNLKALADSNGLKGIIRSTPFGNTILKDLAMAAIKNETMGEDSITDFLAVSFSSTDYVGHQFGPHSIEIEDTYLRLDQDLAELISFIEEKVGKENVLFFLTADHGAVPVPQYLMDNNKEGGYFDVDALENELKVLMAEKFKSDSLIENLSNYQVFLNQEELRRLSIDKTALEDLIVKHISTKEGVAYAMTGSNLLGKTRTQRPLLQALNGYHTERSGDVLFVLKYGWIEEYGKVHQGTTHGSPYEYDTHVPLLWYGGIIEPGKTNEKVVIPDIAATLAELLKTSKPSACSGTTIKELSK